MNHRNALLTALGAAFALASALARPDHDGPDTPFDHHIVFDDPVTAPSFYNSSVVVTAPSALDAVGGRLPLDARHFVTPPNALRLTWRSMPGGDWNAAIGTPGHYNGWLDNFAGDTLTLWCYSPEGIDLVSAPHIFLKDVDDQGTPTISLLQAPLPAGKWVQLRLPLSAFHGLYGSTDVSLFNPKYLDQVVFVQGLDDGHPHTLYVDDIELVNGSAPETAPAAPTGLAASAGERHVDLEWEEPAGSAVMRYLIFRSEDGGPYEPVGFQEGRFHRYADFVGRAGAKVSYRVVAEAVGGARSQPSGPAAAATRPMDDDALLTMVQKGCFEYYWANGHPNAGMAIEITPGDPNLVALGSSGFGVMAILVGADRGFVTRAAAAERLLKITHFLQHADRYHGAWSHYLDGRTGRTIPYFGPYDDGGDLVETAFLMQGLLAARQYFNGASPVEKEVRDNITALWQSVEWDWYRRTPNSPFLYWHWSPDHAWQIGHPLVGWNETMIVYLLAIASPTHGVPGSMYYSGWASQSPFAVAYRRGWSRALFGDHYANGHSYYGIKLDVGEGSGGDLFFTQFSFLGFDPRGRRDRFTNYFSNNRRLALVNRAYCIANPAGYAGYGADFWGISAGVNSGGGTPEPKGDNGTICCSAALGDFPYTPQESMAVLKHLYRDLGPKAWGIYGFYDGVNPSLDWYEPVWMGLNQAQIVVGIENYRSGLLWKMFMRNPEIAPALQRAGFTPDPE